MNCMKCGREIPEGQVFCQACTDVMAQYPVNPGTPIHLPTRAPAGGDKKTAKRQPSTLRERFLHQRNLVKWLLFTIGILVLVVCVLAGALLYTLQGAPFTLP